MTIETLARLVVDMRAAQRDYFCTRSTAALEKSKALEKRVDEACREAIDQPSLFGEGSDYAAT